MRVFSPSGRAPIGRLLQIINFIGCEVSSVCLFAVRVTDLPMLASERIAVFIEQIEFSDSSRISSILCIQCFQAEVTGLDWYIEPDFLPAVAGL